MVETGQIGLVWRIVRRMLSGPDQVLNDLLDKARFELDDTRHAAPSAAHNFAMFKQSLVNQLAQDNKVLVKAKRTL